MNFYLLKGSTQQVFKLLNLTCMIAPKKLSINSTKETPIQMDIPRHRFLGSEQDAKNHFARWHSLGRPNKKTTSNDKQVGESYFQGQMDGSFYRLMFSRQLSDSESESDIGPYPYNDKLPFNVEEVDAKLKEIHFAYPDAAGRDCSFYLQYLSNEPHSWRIAIVKDIDKPVDQQQCTIASAHDLQQALKDNSNVERVESIAIVRDNLLDQANSIMVSNILKTIINPDDGSININSDILNFLLVVETEQKLSASQYDFYQNNVPRIINDPLLQFINNLKLGKNSPVSLSFKYIRSLLNQQGLFYLIIKSISEENRLPDDLKKARILAAIYLDQIGRLNRYDKLNDSQIRVFNNLVAGYTEDRQQQQLKDLLSDDESLKALSLFSLPTSFVYYSNLEDEEKKRLYLELASLVEKSCKEIYGVLSIKTREITRENYKNIDEEYRRGIYEFAYKIMQGVIKPSKEEIKDTIDNLAQPLMEIADVERKPAIRAITNFISKVLINMAKLIHVNFTPGLFFTVTTKSHKKLVKQDRMVEEIINRAAVTAQT